MSMYSRTNRFALILTFFILFTCVIYYLILIPFNNAESTTSQTLNTISIQQEQLVLNKPHNVSYSIPALWIFGPAKTSTTSIYTALASSFPNWHHPEPNKPFREYPQIWTRFLTDNYFASKHYTYFNELITLLDNINQNKSIQTLTQYPFYDILTLLKPHIIQKQLNKQYSTFENIINASKYDTKMLVIAKTPAHYYSPYIPIIFAHYISPINYNSNKYGTNVLILLRNSVKRTISWYSLFYIKKFVHSYKNKNDVFELIRYQMNVSLSYKPLIQFRNMIINRKNEFDDIGILNEYFKFFYGFSRLFKKCNSIKFNVDIYMECKAIDIGLYDKKWNYENIKYKYINHVRHPIHMIFVGLSYAHLLLPLIVFKQNNLLGSKFRFMFFNYIISKPKQALYLMTCWSEGNICDIDKYRNTHSNIWENINLPHQKHETLPIPQDIKDRMSEYYEPVIVQINELFKRFNTNNDIFLGDWYRSDW